MSTRRGRLLIPLWEMDLQALYRMSPLRRRRLTHCVLITKEPHLIDSLCDGYSIEPMHAHEILGLFRIIRVALVKLSVFKHVEGRPVTGRCLNFKVLARLHRLRYASHT